MLFRGQMQKSYLVIKKEHKCWSSVHRTAAAAAAEQGPHTVKLERNYDVETWRSDAAARSLVYVAQFPVLSNQAALPPAIHANGVFKLGCWL